VLQGADLLREERLQPFREQVRLSLEKLPRGILAPYQLDKLILAGIESYGLDREIVQQTIHEIAGQLRIAVIATAQAEQYVSDLVAELLGDDPWLKVEKRERVMQVGAQWGLSPARVEELIRWRVAEKRGARKRDEATARLALGAAACAVLFVIAFLAYAVIGGRGRRSEPPTESAVSRPARPPTLPTADPELDDRWWGVRLAFAVEQARSALPALQPYLREIAAREGPRRQAAYIHLTRELLRADRTETERRLLSDVLSGCLALEPQDEVLQDPVAQLLDHVPSVAGELPDETEEIGQVFWAVKAVIGALADKATAPAARPSSPTVWERPSVSRSTRLSHPRSCKVSASPPSPSGCSAC
jgi:hypothetical protein